MDVDARLRYQHYRATSSVLNMEAAITSKTLILLIPNYIYYVAEGSNL
jgi:hypothetical protein